MGLILVQLSTREVQTWRVCPTTRLSMRITPYKLFVLTPHQIKASFCFTIFVEESCAWYSVTIALLWDHKASRLLPTPEGHIQFHPVNSSGQEEGVGILKTLVCAWSHHYFLSLRLINCPAINGQLHQSMWRKWISLPLHFHIHKYNKSLFLSPKPPGTYGSENFSPSINYGPAVQTGIWPLWRFYFKRWDDTCSWQPVKFISRWAPSTGGCTVLAFTYNWVIFALGQITDYSNIMLVSAKQSLYLGKTVPGNS